MKKRVVITGIGVVAPNGIGKQEFWDNCFAGVSGIKPITLFDTSEYRCHLAGEIHDFQPEKYLGQKGLRNSDRTTLLALVAAKLAIDDAALEINDTNRHEIGVVLGSTMGSVHSISEFDKEGLREGPRYVNPSHFPNTVINSPASQVAIRFGLQGLNSTISTGFTASLDAIGYALNMLQLGRARILLVGGVEELCIQTFLGFYKLGFLATARNGTPLFYAPFDLRRCGALLGEGAVFFVLETIENAQARGVSNYAGFLSYHTQFHPDSMYRYDPEARGSISVMRQALADAGLKADAINCISSCANGNKAGDAMELTAVRDVFGQHINAIPLSAVKSMVGEAFSASAAFQLAIAVGAIVRQEIPPTINVEQKDPLCNGHWIPSTSQQAQVTHVLVNSFGPAGVLSSLITSAVTNGSN